jgi:hypothetical protein
MQEDLATGVWTKVTEAAKYVAPEFKVRQRTAMIAWGKYGHNVFITPGSTS